MMGAASAVVAAAIAVSAPGLADAHALVIESRPPADAKLTEPPTEIYLRFNSKLEKRLSHATISTEKGKPVALPIAAGGNERPDRLVLPLAPLSPGSYLVRYKVLAVDGHITEGILRFSVLEPK